MSDAAGLDELVEHFDHHDPRLWEDPHTVYAELLRRCPVAHSDNYGGFWIVSAYEEVRFVLKRYDLFTTYPTVSIPAGLGSRRPMLPLEVDPPLQAKYRSLLNPVFAPGRVAALEARIRSTCTQLIDAFINRGECEFIAELAMPLPTRLFTEMMGLPTEEAERFHDWKNIILHGHHDDPDGARRAATGRELQAYLRALLEDRKAQRRDDILSLLIDSEFEDGHLTDEEILDITYLLFLAGLDTVAGSLGLHFLYLAENPDKRDLLVADPALIPGAVEELLRYESPILPARTVTQDLELGGAQMREGDRVLINMVAADRDPNEFDRPDEVIFDRYPNRHIAFAVGPHRCVGSHLARLELKVVYEEMHRRIPDYRLNPGAEVHRHGGSVAGLDELVLVWSRP